MVKYKEIVSMVLDMLKITSDDSVFTEEHIIFLAGRYRSFLLKQRYSSDLKKQIPESNYQTLCLNLELVEAIEGFPCIGGFYLRSTEKVPDTLPFGTTRLYTSGSYYNGEITFVTKDRFKYVGNNKWMQNIIYATLDPSGRIYLTSKNPQFKYLEGSCIKFTGVFENAEEASKLACCDDSEATTDECDILDKDFPLEDALISPLIELVAKELSPSVAAPEDAKNNANDELSPNA